MCSAMQSHQPLDQAAQSITGQPHSQWLSVLIGPCFGLSLRSARIPVMMGFTLNYTWPWFRAVMLWWWQLMFFAFWLFFFKEALLLWLLLVDTPSNRLHISLLTQHSCYKKTKANSNSHKFISYAYSILLTKIKNNWSEAYIIFKHYGLSVFNNTDLSVFSGVVFFF